MNFANKLYKKSAICNYRYTLKGIHQNNTFSVNVPSVDIAKETDYCGIESGSKVDKVTICGFDVFYGKVETAPMVEQCPVNLECSVVHTLNLGSHSLVVGRIEETLVLYQDVTASTCIDIDNVISLTDPALRKSIWELFGIWLDQEKAFIVSILKILVVG